MKKMNILKIAFTLVLAFVIFGASAQQMDANLLTDNGTAHTVTINKAIPFHVTPDAYFNPGYVAAGWTVTSSFLWSADNAVITGGSNPGTLPTFAGADPTVINPDVTFTAAGAYVLAAQETSTDGCAGSIQLQTVTVIAVPDLGFTVVDPADACGDVAAFNVLFNIAANGEATYLVDWNINVDNLSADQLSITDNYDGDADAANPSGTDLDVTTTDAAHGASGVGLTLTNQAFPVLNSEVTRYTFTLTGINGAVSRVSDYIAPNARAWPIATFTDYPVTGGASGDAIYELIVLPAPTTGPIYHLTN